MTLASLPAVLAWLVDLTVPALAVCAGSCFSRGLREALGGGDIRDTWIPFYCNSCAISHYKQVPPLLHPPPLFRTSPAAPRVRVSLVHGGAVRVSWEER
eukprot:2223484-Rhodomonas_salina.1